MTHFITLIGYGFGEGEPATTYHTFEEYSITNTMAELDCDREEAILALAMNMGEEIEIEDGGYIDFNDVLWKVDNTKEVTAEEIAVLNKFISIY
jgi:hypothetical protein